LFVGVYERGIDSNYERVLEANAVSDSGSELACFIDDTFIHNKITVNALES
jgi:hypothetical protein